MMRVQQVALETSLAGLKVVAGGARGYGELVDQFKRAIVSVPLNITEGLGRRGKDQLRFLRIAYASAEEASMALALLVGMGFVPVASAQSIESGLDQVRAMLYRMPGR